MKQSKRIRKGIIEMCNDLEFIMEKKIKIELKTWELYLLSIVACKSVGLSKKILKSEKIDEEIIEAANTMIVHEIPRIAFKVMDQIGIFKVADILPESNKKGIKR